MAQVGDAGEEEEEEEEEKNEVGWQKNKFKETDNIVKVCNSSEKRVKIMTVRNRRMRTDG